MIPKQLFFIWFGDKPNYVDFSIKAFKDINPSFNVELIYEKDPYRSSNKDIKYILESLNDKSTPYYELCNREYAKKFYYKNDIGKLSALCDCLRFYLINKYGGIYLDCDTFPIKPFDNELLEKNTNIITKVYIKKHDWYDCFFIGSQINSSPLLYRYVIPEKYGRNLQIYKDLYVYKNIAVYHNYNNGSLFKNKKDADTYKKFYDCVDPDIRNDNSKEYFCHFRKLSYM